jgi:rifampicin phosphotransferase
MDTGQTIAQLAEATAQDGAAIGGKAANLAQLATAGFPVPCGFVVTAAALDDPQLDRRLADATNPLGSNAFAVRSSGVAEDLADASYAGLYETYLNVPADGLGETVRRCFAAASSDRVVAYHQRRGGGTAAMAVLVQTMVDPIAAGVAFTAHPVTGDGSQTVLTAVGGLGEPLVSGETTGEEWTVTTDMAAMTRPGPARIQVLTPPQAQAVARLALKVQTHYGGRPQDVEWAIDHDGKLWLLQARPMTAVPEPVSWAPPGPGLWMRNFRLGEWLPEAVTPLFGTWLLPILEDGYLAGMADTVRVRVPFRYALINGWYYNATPIPSPKLLGRVIFRGRARAVKTLFNALIRVGRNPDAADRAVLAKLEHVWRQQQAPRYRQLVAAAAAEAPTATPQRLAWLVEVLGREAGVWFWYLAIVGGSAWKMEGCLRQFARQHLASVLPDEDGGSQVLLRGLPGTAPVMTTHAVQSVDWFHPLAADLHPSLSDHDSLALDERRHEQLAAQRIAAEQHCHAALAKQPRLLAQFERLLRVNQRYAVIREQQARDFTLAWPVLRTCAARLGEHLTIGGLIERPDDVFFATRGEVFAALAGNTLASIGDVDARRERWQRQRRLVAPLTLGRPARIVGDVIDRAAHEARGDIQVAEGTVVGHPASAGRATGPVRVVHGTEDFPLFQTGEVLVAKATAPAWTPLFGRAAAVVTDGGTLAAHASLVAREYGIPAVVGTGDATTRLHDGQVVTVDGTGGTVTPV